MRVYRFIDLARPSACRAGRLLVLSAFLAACAALAAAAGNSDSPPAGTNEFRLLATTKTSTMEKEMNAAAAEGFRFAGVMGGDTAAGGAETVAVFSRPAGSAAQQGYEYRLLAARRTGTMQEELRQAGERGFRYCGQKVFGTALGGREVVCILERCLSSSSTPFEFKLLATSRTSTMQRELNEAGAEGYRLLGLTVGETMLGGKELVCILGREPGRPAEKQ